VGAFNDSCFSRHSLLSIMSPDSLGFVGVCAIVVFIIQYFFAAALDGVWFVFCSWLGCGYLWGGLHVYCLCLVMQFVLCSKALADWGKSRIIMNHEHA